MNLSGEWKGYYIYGLGYDPDFFGQKVLFSMTLEEKNGDFNGYVKEESSPFSVKHRASVKGYVEDNVVSFTKTYPVRPVINLKGIIEEQSGELIVNHHGELRDDCMCGLWTIEIKTIENELQECEGLWILKKI